MTAKSSCIQHPPRANLVILRDEYLQICEGNHCAAMLLSVFEYWHNVKLAGAEQAEIDAAVAAKTGATPQQSSELWVYKTQANLKEDLLGLFGETKVLAATRLLIAAGFVSTRSNPKYAWDHTTQYLFSPSKVQSAITQKYVAPSRKSKQSIARKQAIKAPKTKATIPETTPQTTSETTEKEKEVPLVDSYTSEQLKAISDPLEQKRVGAEVFASLMAKTNGNGSKPYTDEEIRQQTAALFAKYGKKTT